MSALKHIAAGRLDSSVGRLGKAQRADDAGKTSGVRHSVPIPWREVPNDYAR